MDSLLINRFGLAVFLIVAIIMNFVMTTAILSENLALVEQDKSGLNGYVRDTKTGETLVGATVMIDGTKFGARTNKSGYFVINNVPPGKYKVTVSFLGYEKIVQELELMKGQSLRQEFELLQGSVMQEEVYVDAERELEKRQISISKVNVPIQTIKNMRIGGESDIFRSLQYLPGVLTSSQISSGLFVRGGSPDQNLVLLDGSAVYNPTHLFGFISTFNIDAIKDVELIKGGFDAEYGGRLSAVLNITQSDGNRKKYEGVASIGAISSRAGFQGPIGNGSWFISGRRTYFDLVKKLIPEDPEAPIPDFGFYDVNAKITQDFGPNDRVSLSGFLSNDNLQFSSFGLEMAMDVGNRLLAGKWTHIFQENLFTTVNASYSKYYNNFAGDQTGYEFLIDNSITDYTVKANAEWFVSDELTTKFGVESSFYTFGYLQNFTGSTDSTAQDTSGTSTNLSIEDIHTNIFGQFKLAVSEPLSIQAGLRLNYWQLSNLITYDPRLSARYRFSDKFAVKAAWGVFHQNLRLASQPNFSFFDTWLPTDNSVPASSAVHYILSFETEPIPKHNFNFDFYYKELTNVSELNTNALKGLTVGDVFYIGNATAWGAEIFLQKKFGRLNGWVGYAIGFITSRFDSINNGEPFRPKYDRTHDFKVVLNYELNVDWDLGASFFFQTGQSYTGATSRFQTRLKGQEIGRGKVVPSQRFGLRLPPSHQLNITGSYKFLMWGLESKFIIDIYNVYSRRDILVRFWNTREETTYYEDVQLIPILPTVSLEVKF